MVMAFPESEVACGSTACYEKSHALKRVRDEG